MELLTAAGLKAIKFSSVFNSDNAADTLCYNFTLICSLRGYTVSKICAAERRLYLLIHKQYMFISNGGPLTTFFVGDDYSAEPTARSSQLLPCLLTRIHSLWHAGFCCFLLCTGNIKVCIGNELLKRSRRKLVLPPGDLTRVCSSLTPEGSAPAAVIESCSHQFFLCQTNDGCVTYPKQKLYWQIFFLLRTCFYLQLPYLRKEIHDL